MFSFGKPSKSKFASQLKNAIGELTGQEYRYDADNFMLLQKDGDNNVNLTNLYKEHCSLSSAERKENIKRLASIFGDSVEELPENFEEAKQNLRPKIWNRSTFEFMELKRQINGGEAADLPLYPLGSHLYSSLVYDTDNAMRTVSNENMRKWGTTYFEALEIACERLHDTTMVMTKIGDGFHSSVSGDNYDSSRILLVNRNREFDVDGDYISTIPHRDVMYLTGSEDQDSLSKLFELTAKATEEELRPLSPLPLRLVDGQWEDWVPPRNHALRSKYDEMELRFLSELYGDQKELLDVLNEQRGVDIFVASFSAIKKDDTEQILSYCVWSRGVPSLLPKTQFVVFVDDSGVIAAGEWHHVADVVQPLMFKDESFYPTRFKVDDFPSAEQLSAIGIAEEFAQ